VYWIAEWLRTGTVTAGLLRLQHVKEKKRRKSNSEKGMPRFVSHQITQAESKNLRKFTRIF
jgi:hypothetical protein